MTQLLLTRAPLLWGLVNAADPPASGAPRPGQPQDWQHRSMRKGFVSERDLNPHAHDLRIYVAI
jgi:hypothetical protein